MNTLDCIAMQYSHLFKSKTRNENQREILDNQRKIIQQNELILSELYKNSNENLKENNKIKNFMITAKEARELSNHGSKQYYEKDLKEIEKCIRVATGLGDTSTLVDIHKSNDPAYDIVRDLENLGYKVTKLEYDSLYCTHEVSW